MFLEFSVSGAAIYCTAVMEYVAADLLDMGSQAAIDNKKRITPRHLLLSIKNDAEFNELLKDVTIAEGGVLPRIHSSLLKLATKHRRSIK